jgi:hypothetical protein
MSLVERGGKVRSRHVADVTATTLKPLLVETIAKDTHSRTDQAPVYTEIGKSFASHETANHSIKEYVRGDAHTNTRIPIRLRVISRSSSAAFTASTTMSASST